MIVSCHFEHFKYKHAVCSIISYPESASSLHHVHFLYIKHDVNFIKMEKETRQENG